MKTKLFLTVFLSLNSVFAFANSPNLLGTYVGDTSGLFSSPCKVEIFMIRDQGMSAMLSSNDKYVQVTTIEHQLVEGLAQRKDKITVKNETGNFNSETYVEAVFTFDQSANLLAVEAKKKKTYVTGIIPGGSTKINCVSLSKVKN